ncbi:Uncharacterized protein Rs2_33365 [Raphanus sativus]|nr:Uncharacterized protein Rs2_33365 [Raphanus sativus]
MFLRSLRDESSSFRDQERVAREETGEVYERGLERLNIRGRFLVVGPYELLSSYLLNRIDCLSHRIWFVELTSPLPLQLHLSLQISSVQALKSRRSQLKYQVASSSCRSTRHRNLSFSLDSNLLQRLHSVIGVGFV